MKIFIDEEKCTGCGQCVPNCHLGIIRIVDGKARVTDISLCDGMGRCIGHCPTGALRLVEEAEGASPRDVRSQPDPPPCGCPGTQVRLFRGERGSGGAPRFSPHPAPRPEGLVSELRQWPVQLKLLPVQAPFLRGADLVLAADCTAFSRADFHDRFLRGRVLAIACPKLDGDPSAYQDKIAHILAEASPRSLHVVQMEVPCCNGIFQIAFAAWKRTGSKIPLRRTVIGVEGEIMEDTWISDSEGATAHRSASHHPR